MLAKLYRNAFQVFVICVGSAVLLVAAGKVFYHGGVPLEPAPPKVEALAEGTPLQNKHDTLSKPEHGADVLVPRGGTEFTEPDLSAPAGTTLSEQSSDSGSMDVDDYPRATDRSSVRQHHLTPEAGRGGPVGSRVHYRGGGGTTLSRMGSDVPPPSRATAAASDGEGALFEAPNLEPEGAPEPPNIDEFVAGPQEQQPQDQPQGEELVFQDEPIPHAPCPSLLAIELRFNNLYNRTKLVAMGCEVP